MIAQGLRALMSGLAPVLNGAKNMAKAAPVSTALGATVAASMAHDAVSTSPKEALESRRGRFYKAAELHKPSEAALAYMDDDFARAAFKAAPDFETYSMLLKNGDVPAEIGFDRDEYEAITNDPKTAGAYLSKSARDDHAKLANWEKGWDKKELAADPFLQKRMQNQALVLQQMGR